jgi:hypothetical protein
MRKRLTPAMVVALIALFVALTSTATATVLITGKQIKDGSIQLRDLSPKAKLALKGQRGPRGYTGLPGTAGPAGPAGATGAAGPAGGFDPSKLMHVTGNAIAVAPESFGTATATCPSGLSVISGGFHVSAADLAEVDGSHVMEGNSWQVLVYNWDVDFPAEVVPYAVCAAK